MFLHVCNGYTIPVSEPCSLSRVAHGRMRDELLVREIFLNVKEA
jgi:hypothetical protein